MALVFIVPGMMQNPISKRLRLEMARQNLSSTELAKRADLKPSFIYDVLSGKSANPSPLKLSRVAEVLGVNLAYLVGSLGDRAAAGVHALPDVDTGGDDDVLSIPRLSIDAPAGGGTTTRDDDETSGDFYYFRRSWVRSRLGARPSDLRLMFIRGDSMEPTLCHNDVVLVDTSRRQPTPPGIFVLYDGFGLVAKRLELIADAEEPSVRVLSDNPHYSAYEKRVDETRIAGRIVWFAREI